MTIVHLARKRFIFESMPYMIGMDEAGFGPNLGPLVISATLWHAPGGLGPDDLYDVLAAAVAPGVSSGDDRLAIADSKILYQPRRGLRLLERALFPALAVTGRVPHDWAQLWDVLEADIRGERVRLPWYRDYQLRLPLAEDASELDRLAERLRGALGRARVRLVMIRAQAIFPAEWNRLVEECGTKGAALSRTALELLANVMATVDDGSVLCLCDKHGGRNHYGALLQRQFPDWLVEVREEGRARSIYTWGPAAARVEMRFCSGGEAFLPIALASVACKYLREMAMRAENDFWCNRVRGLRRTAGYPADAKRFKTEIAAQQKMLGIDDRMVWRAR
jgi:hypothetical protein